MDDKGTLLPDTSPQSPHAGRVYLAWTRRDSGAVVVAYSDDRGRDWSKPVQIGTGWGVHLAIARAGGLYAAWWDTGALLEIAKSSDGGSHFGAPANFRLVGFAGGSVEAMRHQPVWPDPSLAADTTTGRYAGRIYAAYSVPSRHRRVVAVTVIGANLKPLFTRVVSPRLRKRTQDEFDATVAVDQTYGRVWLCFYLTGSGDRRRLATYACSTSSEGGVHWSRIRAAASAPSDEAQKSGFTTLTGIDSNYGPYQGLAVTAGVAHPIWTDTRKMRAMKEEIYASKLSG